MSSYFSGPKPGFAGKATSLAPNENTPKVKPKAKPKPVPLPVKAKPQPKKVPLPPVLGGPGKFAPTPKSVAVAQKAAAKIPKPPPLSKHALAQQGFDAATKSMSLGTQADNTLGMVLGAKPSKIVKTLKTDLPHPIRSVLHNQAPKNPTMALPQWGGRLEEGLGKDAVDAVAPHLTPEGGVVRANLKGAKSLAGKQVSLQNQERGKRFAAAQVHLANQALDPADRVRLAKQELAGELPKINFQGFNELNPDSVKALQSHILDHPHLLPGQKIRASDALTNALAGKVPTKSENQLLEHVFGKDNALSLGGIATHPWKDKILSAANVPRSLMASFDLSAPFRQGLVVGTRHPAIFAKNFGPMVKAFGSEKFYNGILEDIHSRPSYPLMMQSGLSITSLGKSVGDREEQFASDYAEKIPVIGHGVRWSGRAYTGYLDKLRADTFDHLIQRAQGQGINVQDEKFLKSLGTYINSATGRGDLGKFQEAGKVMNAFFFSPRLMASRLNFLNPAYYARLDPFARKEALRSGIQLAGTLSALLAVAAHVKGVKVVSDPRNPDWGKMKMGNTRVDLAGGFQQPLRLLAQLATGVAISSTTGKKLSLTAGGFGQPTRLDLGLRFFEGKESPIASLATDWLRNSNQVGQKFSARTAITQRMIPLLAQDSYDLYKAKHGGMNGLEAAFAGYGVGSVGFGLQTYGPRVPKAKVSKTPASYFGGSSSSGGSPYFGGSSSSGGSSYFGG